MIKDFIYDFEKKNIFSSILLIFFAILLMIEPISMTETIILLIGALALIDGIVGIISYFMLDNRYRMLSFSLFEGIIYLITGILIIINYKELVNVLPVILGIIIIVKNIFKMQLAVNFRQLGYADWLLEVITSIVTIILGIVIIANPFQSMASLVMISGIIILVSEIINIIYSVIALSKFKKVDRNIKDLFK